MKKINIIGARMLAALEGNLVMTLLPNVLRSATRWGSRAAGVSCLFITMAAGAQGCGWIDNFVGCSSPLPGPMGPNGPVRALTTFNGYLIVGGQFSGVDDPGNCVAPYPQTSTACIAGWDGAGWFSLGDPVTGVGMNNSVLALTTFNGELIAGGLFTSANGVPANHIAKWNGTTWSPLGAGLSAEVYALTTFNGELYAGGSFMKSGATTVNFIAKWDGTSWSKLGNGNGVGMSGIVYALTTFNGELYAGGEFVKAGKTAANHIARGNGTTWSALGSGTSGTVRALTTFDDDGLGPNPTRLYAGGSFATAGGVTVNSIARWNGSPATWSALGSGMNGPVLSLATYTDAYYGTALYAGGGFTAARNAGGVTVLNTTEIARWSAGTWSALGLGMVGGAGQSVYALTTFDIDNHLYAGGYCQVAPAPPGDGYFGAWSGCP